jgi:hypothetical protein
MHAALRARISGEQASAGQANLYAVAYRPVPGDGQTEVQIWEESLTLGQPLPNLPLWLKTGQCLPLELEATYEQTCRELRLVAGNGVSP